MQSSVASASVETARARCAVIALHGYDSRAAWAGERRGRRSAGGSCRGLAIARRGAVAGRDGERHVARVAGGAFMVKREGTGVCEHRLAVLALPPGRTLDKSKSL